MEFTDMMTRLGRTIGDTIKNLWRNRLMSVAAISSITATLIILGIIFTLIVNITSMTQSAKDQFDTIQVYIEDSVDISEMEAIGKELLAINGIDDVRFKSKEQALEEMRESWDSNSYLLDGLERNPLPNSFVIYLDDIVYSESVLDKISETNGVEEVKSYQEIVDKLIVFTELIQQIGLTLTIILMGISIFIINNTIRIAVNSRKREINIMKYVGATSWYIRWPFLLEGTFLGLVSALLSVLVINIGYNYVFEILTSEFYVLIAAYVVRPTDLISDLTFLFVVIGMGMGMLGSILSMRKHLNV